MAFRDRLSPPPSQQSSAGGGRKALRVDAIPIPQPPQPSPMPPSMLTPQTPLPTPPSRGQERSNPMVWTRGGGATTPTPPPSAGPQQVVYVYNIRGRGALDDDEGRADGGSAYPRRAVHFLAFVQIAVAFAVIINQIILIVNRDKYAHLGTGVWAGLAFGLAGTMGTFSAYKTTYCTITTSLVLNVIASFFTVLLIGFSSAALTTEDEMAADSQLTLHACLILLAVAEGLVSAVCQILCFRVVCRLLWTGDVAAATSELELLHLRPEARPSLSKAVMGNSRKNSKGGRSSPAVRNGSEVRSNPVLAGNSGGDEKEGRERFTSFFSVIDEDE